MKVQVYNYWASIKNNLVHLYQQSKWPTGLDWTRKALAIKSRDADLLKYKRLFTQNIGQREKGEHLQQQYQQIVSLTQQERWQDAMDLLKENMPKNSKDAKPFRELYKKLDPIVRGQEIVDLVNQGEYRQAHRKFKQLRNKYRSNQNVKSLGKMMREVPQR